MIRPHPIHPALPVVGQVLEQPGCTGSRVLRKRNPIALARHHPHRDVDLTRHAELNSVTGLALGAVEPPIGEDFGNDRSPLLGAATRVVAVVGGPRRRSSRSGGCGGQSRGERFLLSSELRLFGSDPGRLLPIPGVPHLREVGARRIERSKPLGLHGGEFDDPNLGDRQLIACRLLERGYIVRRQQGAIQRIAVVLRDGGEVGHPGREAGNVTHDDELEPTSRQHVHGGDPDSQGRLGVRRLREIGLAPLIEPLQSGRQPGSGAFDDRKRTAGLGEVLFRLEGSRLGGGEVRSADPTDCHGTPRKRGAHEAEGEHDREETPRSRQGREVHRP